MYNIDINFLKDRPEYQPTAIKAGAGKLESRISRSSYSKTPIYVGLGVGLLALIATGGSWLYLDHQGKQLQAQQEDLDRQLGAIKSKETKLNEVLGQVAQAEQESQSLASVFNVVRPWSAILQEFRDSIPQGAQLQSIAQIVSTGAAANAAPPKASKLAAAPPAVDNRGVATKPGASPSASASPAAGASASPAASSAPPAVAEPVAKGFDGPVTRIELEGIAQSFNDVNTFMLTLKNSPFFNPKDTQLISANLVEEKVTVTNPDPNVPAQTITTKSVKYKLQTSLQQVAAAELLRELERKGAFGLVTRLKSLQQQKVIKP
jgi:type IV pilus assembly protein PilN